MTNETLSSKRMFFSDEDECVEDAITFKFHKKLIVYPEKHVKDFIQKLKEEYLKIPQRVFIKVGDDEILKIIDKLAGDDLIHSPQEVQPQSDKRISPKGVCEVTPARQPEGTHGQQTKPHTASLPKDGVSASLEKELSEDKTAGTFDKIGCKNCGEKRRKSDVNCSRCYGMFETTDNPKGCGKLLGQTIRCGDGKEDDALILCKDCRPENWGSHNQDCTKSDGYVEEEDCHCFCCGSHNQNRTNSK